MCKGGIAFVSEFRFSLTEFRYNNSREGWRIESTYVAWFYKWVKEGMDRNCGWRGGYNDSREGYGVESTVWSVVHNKWNKEGMDRNCGWRGGYNDRREGWGIESIL